MEGPGSLFIRQLSILSCCKDQGLVVFPESHKAPVTVETVKASFRIIPPCGIREGHVRGSAAQAKADVSVPDARQHRGRGPARSACGDCSGDENTQHPLVLPPALRGALWLLGLLLCPQRSWKGWGRGGEAVTAMAPHIGCSAASHFPQPCSVRLGHFSLIKNTSRFGTDAPPRPSAPA